MRIVARFTSAARYTAPRILRVRYASGAAGGGRSRRYVGLVGVSLALGTVAPLIYSVGAAYEAPPAHAVHLLGTWKHINEDGEAQYIRFNRHGMVSVETEGLRQRGAAGWPADGSGFNVKPLLPWQTAASVGVRKWPASEADTWILSDGTQFTKQQ